MATLHRHDTPLYYYQVFGLILQSEIPLPLFPIEASEQMDVDAVLSLAPIPSAAGKQLFYHQTNADVTFTNYLTHGTFESYVRVSEHDQFYIKDGHDIRVDFQYQQIQSANQIRYFVNSILSNLLCFRKKVLIHGGAVAYNGKAYLLTGVSGAGKSTTACALMQAGFDSLEDDICLLDWIDGQVHIVPGPPFMKIPERIKHSKEEDLSFVAEFKKLEDEQKYLCILDPSRTVQQPVPLSKIIEIVISDTEEGVKEITGMEKLVLLNNSHARPIGLDTFGTHQDFALDCLRLAPETTLIRVYRKPNEFVTDTIKEIIMNDQAYYQQITT